MNRETRFRAWDGKKFYYTPDFNLSFTKSGIICGLKNGGMIFPNSNELQQFTGLKDKNGKEIYESDVVSIKGDKRKFYIRWFDNMCFGFADVRSDYKETFYACYDDRNGYPMDSMIEIIGNIHQNPELIEVKDEHNKA